MTNNVTISAGKSLSIFSSIFGYLHKLVNFDLVLSSNQRFENLQETQTFGDNFTRFLIKLTFYSGAKIASFVRWVMSKCFAESEFQTVESNLTFSSVNELTSTL